MAKTKDSKKTMTLEYLNENARYLYVVIRYYDEPKENLVSFYNEAKECLDENKDFEPPMLNKEHKMLLLLIDLKTLKVLDWNGGYLRMWGKIRYDGTYNLLDENFKSIWQISRGVPNKLIPPYEHGWNEYLELVIEPDGSLKDWHTPLDISDFIEYGHEPKLIETNRWYRVKDALWDICQRKLNKEEFDCLLEQLQKLRQYLFAE